MGRRRADDRDRERGEGAAARRSHRHRRAGDRGAARGVVRAGEPVAIDYEPSFVDGAGGRALLPTMWARAQELVDEAVAVPLADVEAAVRTLASRARVVAEGAGALAARRRASREGRSVCIVSGGNIDLAVLREDHAAGAVTEI